MSGNSTNNLLLENIAINVVRNCITYSLNINYYNFNYKNKKYLKKQVVEEITHKEKPTDNYRDS